MNEDKKLERVLIPFFCAFLLLKSILHAVLQVRKKKSFMTSVSQIGLLKSA